MVVLKLKRKFNESQLETGALVLGFKEIRLLFNAGSFPGGGDCLFVEADGEVLTINSNDLIHDLDVYDLSRSA